ncbi:MAG TPA: PIN domain-containing protein [Acidobacteriaceae bacterium]|nr:PIN domain-containing protein [Acidobacteriaceae bacterium]
MKDKTFFDSNIFIYAYDVRDARKQGVALNMLQRARDEGSLVISYQVIQEFFNFALRRAAVKMRHEDALRMLTEVFRPLEIVAPSLLLVSEAIRIQERFKLSWYDSLIVAAAEHAGCAVLYSEDLQHGQQFGGVTVRDPFR